MVKLTKLFCVLVLCLFGIATANAKVEQVHATFENPSNTNTTWNAETRTFTWSTTYYNQLRNIGLPSGDITKYKKLVVDCDIKSGDQFRILIYKGGSNKTLYASNGVNEFILADTLKALYPDDYNEFLLNCDEICLSGNNNAAPGEAVINDVYLETYNDEGEKVYATFENPSNTNTSWDAETNTFKWTTTYYNQLRNIGLPSGDITKYKKLVVDTEIKSGDQFRILFYKGGSNKTLYASNGVNEFILADTLKALYPDDYNEFLLACDEICLSGNNNAAPGEAVINSVYLETYPENESVEIPDIVYEEDPGKPAGDFVDFTEVFPNLQPRLGLGEDGHPIVLGNGDVVVGQRSKNVIADLSPYTKLTLVTSPNLKLVLYMNHEIDAKQNAGDYTEEEAGKYLFQDLQADENGLIEYDLTQLDKQELNCICLPWDNSNKGTVWYILLTEKDGKTIYLNPAIWDVADITERYAAYMFNDYGLNAWADFTATAAARRAENGTAGAYTATIPARYTGIILCRMNGETTENNWENVWNQTEDIKNFDDNTSYTITGWGEGENAKSTYEENAVDVPGPVLTTYTATFTTDKGWEKVYAYAFTKDGENVTEFLGVWPGTELTADAAGVYTVSIEAEAAPAFIIFNNGNSGEGNQTEDLAFEDGKAYTYNISTAEEDPVLTAPEGWTLAVTNGNLAGEDVSSYFAKEYPTDADPVAATIVAGAGKNGSRGILVKAGDDTANENATAWDSQFWIKLNEAVPAGTKVHVEFDYKASQEAKGSTQAHGEPGAYQHHAAIGDVNFTTEWQHFSTDFEVSSDMATGNGGNGLQSIAFNLQEEKSATDYHFDNFGVWYQKPAVISDWTDLIVNGDMEGESTECFYVTEQAIGGPFLAKFTEGIGKDGGKAVKVQSMDIYNTGEKDDQGNDIWSGTDWSTQFFIRLPYQIPAGTKYKVSFDYKADKAGDFDTQAHAEPSDYIHYIGVGSGSFTTEWQTYKKEGTVSADQSKEGKLFQTIAFNLAKNKTATEFIFDNVKFEVPSDVVASLTKNPAVNPQPYPEPITSMVIVGDFLGLEADPTATDDPNWNPANGWQMEQDAENPAIWTLTKPFTAEAKTYKYKATANGKYGDYELPAEGDYEFTFGTEGYPAGDYKLVFTADTENNTLDLVVKPSTILTFTATFTTNAYWWDNVYAYAWSGEGEDVNEYLGEWPGVQLRANADGVYTVTVEGEVAPEKIVFSNGNSGEGNQTEDLDFVDGQAYQYVFNPTFDFENNNGQWADGTQFTEENPAIMDDITLTGVTAQYTTGQLRIGDKKAGSITLTAPEGKSIVQIEFKALKTVDNPLKFEASEGEMTKTKELVEGEGENENIIYSIWTWTGNRTTVSFDGAKRQRNIGFINVTLGEIVPEDIAIYPTGGDIAAALEEAKAKVAKVGDITINLAADGDYTLGATLTAPNNIYVYGNEGTVTVTEEMTGDFITLNGTEVFAMKSETEASDHYLIPSVEIRGLNLKGLKGALVKDAQKTLVENLVIDYSNIEMPASNKNVLDFNGKGYAGKVAVTNSTIWAADKNTGFFAQYGSRPKNINGDWTQEFDIEKSTFVNIANGKNVCDLKQNGTAQNVYTLKNNIFVDCGKSGQTVVGFNKGQTSATPAWDVTGNYFAWGGACVNAAETEKAGQKDSEDIVKNCVEGTLAFTDAANGDFNGRFTLADDAEASEALGAPMWTITYSTPYYLAGNMNNWLNDGVEAEYNLAKNTAAAEGVEEYMITIDLAADAQFKVVKVGGEESIWYPVGSGNAFGENGELEKEGNYTIYFRPNADGGADWFNGVIYVEYNGTTGINAVNTVAQDAVIYDMQGRRVVKAHKGLYIVNGKKTVVK